MSGDAANTSVCATPDRGARTPACRVRTPADTSLSFVESKLKRQSEGTYSRTVNVATEPIVGDHLIDGRILVPGALMVDMILESAGADTVSSVAFISAAAVDKTQARVGLALSQDLPGATRLLEAEEGARGPLARELIAFSTSSRFLRLRKQLGIAVGG